VEQTTASLLKRLGSHQILQKGTDYPRPRYCRSREINPVIAGLWQNSIVKYAGLRSRSRKESEVFGWGWIPNNTGSRSRSRIFLSDSGCPIGSFLTSNSCWNGTISFETFVETDISCCALRFPLILTAKFHSLYIKESEILESRSRIFYLRFRNPGNIARSCFGHTCCKLWKSALWYKDKNTKSVKRAGTRGRALNMIKRHVFKRKK